jgi:hypothetical protein
VFTGEWDRERASAGPEVKNRRKVSSNRMSWKTKGAGLRETATRRQERELTNLERWHMP